MKNLKQILLPDPDLRFKDVRTGPRDYEIRQEDRGFRLCELMAEILKTVNLYLGGCLMSPFGQWDYENHLVEGQQNAGSPDMAIVDEELQRIPSMRSSSEPDVNMD